MKIKAQRHILNPAHADLLSLQIIHLRIKIFFREASELPLGNENKCYKWAAKGKSYVIIVLEFTDGVNKHVAWGDLIAVK